MADAARRTKAPRVWPAPDLHDDPVIRRNYRRVFSELPERAGYEALQEIIRSPDNAGNILQRYADMPDGLLTALGIDRIPPAPLLEVPHD